MDISYVDDDELFEIVRESAKRLGRDRILQLIDIVYTDDFGVPENWNLIQTCGACPEQYDLKDENGDNIAYFRLRHGSFRVEVPDCNGKEVYYANPEGDGCFGSEERPRYMSEAISAVKKHYGI